MAQITKESIKRIENEAKKYFANSSGCHDWTHVMRVRKLAQKIGKKEGADLLILDIAVLLHDVAKKGSFCHAIKGSEVAKKILKQYDLEPHAYNNIVHCIKTHRYRNNHIPETIEAKCLYDADKLDSLGAIGIGRIFLVAGMINSKSGLLYTGEEKRLARSGKDYSYTKHDTAVLEYEVKLKHLKNKLFTAEARRIAKDRHRFMEEYFKRFWEEVEGKK